MEDKSLVRSVVLVTSILELLSNTEELGVTEIAKHVKVHKSTVYRFLRSLTELGYVHQDPTSEKYKISLRLLDLAGHLLSGLDIRNTARPDLERISDSTHETIHLAVLERDEVIYIDKIDSNQPLRMHSYIGQKVPIYATALGKVLLAWDAQSTLQRVLGRGSLPRFTDKTITEPVDLMEELKKIRECGYALDQEESILGVFCIGAPILDIRGGVVAAISISMPKLRFKEERLPYLKDLITEGAAEISQKLGYSVSR
jgi:DNA-binding IclR family transcriptional regulator